MEFNPTPEQEKVINIRGRNLLVSAAAGSGKTAVLVERILGLICDGENPCDVDRLLIVTFTKAAAAEMKERIYRAIEKRRAGNPLDQNLIRQESLVHYAPISTIDSFCSQIVKEHFNEIGINPDFRAGNEGELKILEDEVLEELFEEKFEENDATFIKLCDTFIKRDKLTELKKMIIKLYRESESYPWQEEWISGLKENYNINSEEELMNIPWYKDTLTAVREGLRDLLITASDNLEFVKENLDEMEKAHPYTAVFSSDYDNLLFVLEAETDEEMEQRLLALGFGRLSGKLSEEDAVAKGIATDKRNSYKKEIGKLKELIIPNKEETIELIKVQRPVVMSLFDLVADYGKRLLNRKQEENIYSFSDIEHFALKVLRDENTHEPTDTAKNLKEYYAQIMVDEYQDSNLLQEAILTAITKDGENENYFMVGDVKQSIYRFRKAKPSIFIEKYDSFGADEKNGALVCLSGNFRSIKSVADTVNDVFFEIMHRDIGGIEYDDNAKLESMSDFKEPDDYYKTELLLCNTDDEIFIEQRMDKDSIEARLIGKKILELVGNFKVRDNNDVHACKFSDIVILHRSANKVADAYIQSLKALGIPVVTTGTKGYYKSFEIESMLAMLSVLNNPYDDINLTNVLVNFFGFTKDDLLLIAEYAKRKEIDSFSKGFIAFANDESSPSRFKECLAEYEDIREKIPGKRIYFILQTILKIRDFNKRLPAMPDGKQRQLNVNKLIDMAIGFEKNGAKSLYDFISYISDLREYESDAPGGDTEAGDAVRLMTIHKSKGLEFPICFVSGLTSKFKLPKREDGMIVSDKYGAALTHIDREKSIKIKTPYISAVSRFERIEDEAENQRLLYVALTRAKDKLILTGTGKKDDLDKAMEKHEKRAITAPQRLNAVCFLDLVLPVFLNKEYKIIRYTDEDIIDTAVANIAINNELKNMPVPQKKSEEFIYPIKAATVLKTKYSVSEIKSRHMEIAPADEDFIKEKREFVQKIPSFIEDKTLDNFTAAQRGTAVHRFMECLDFSNADVSKELERMVKSGLLGEKESGLINIKQMENFVNSSLYRRMKAADERGHLYKEKTFVCSMLSKDLFTDMEFSKEEENDTTLIQGIVDAFFVEDGRIVLLDYKTDKVNNEKTLIGRYRSQLDMYADALLRGTGIEIKEKLIYSFELNKEIAL